jgi:micrococcal nuclease
MPARVTAFAPVLALVAGLLAVVGAASPSVAAGEKTLHQKATVVRVVDGDTVNVQLRSGAEKPVRLIGIDTPEVYPVEYCGGPEASRSAPTCDLSRIRRRTGWTGTAGCCATSSRPPTTAT